MHLLKEILNEMQTIIPIRMILIFIISILMSIFLVLSLKLTMLIMKAISYLSSNRYMEDLRNGIKHKSFLARLLLFPLLLLMLPIVFISDIISGLFGENGNDPYPFTKVILGILLDK
ncbi:hypothetical protein DES36_11934 [Alkalibaculum bacchi]|uniref:Uncharacterized protein n=1 Tax=Alkalibaculum bacchi TaxID=645887 RepID=A0A366I0F9_9FIRM|nr:hypothetical protein [Alkalibaculum bacchi]RBP59309.1 hypothetical protein DES36_11934 [Alkalibaculum bacchi]